MTTIPNFRLRVGDVDISNAVTHASTRKALSERNSAEFVVDLEAQTIRNLDFSGEVVAESYFDGQWYVIFAGGVRRILHGGPTSKLYCEGAQGLVVTAAGLLAHQDCNFDVIESLVRGADIPHEIDGLPDRPEEEFEVVVPVSQINVGDFEKIASSVSLISTGRAASVLDRIPDVPQEVRSSFLRSSAYFLSRIRSSSMYAAQKEALAKFDQVLAGLVTGSRYSLFRYPSGVPVPWRRELYQFNPERIELVVVASSSSRRAWIRRTGILALSKPMTATDEPLPRFASLTEHSSLQVRQAFLLCSRAARPGTAVDRITALWQGLEFLVGKQRNKTPVFDREALDRIDLVIEEKLKPVLSRDQVDRLGDVLGQLNDPPLLAKLRKHFSTFEIPITEGEFERLWKLRSYRNKVNHGKEPTVPTSAEIDFGVALMARILVYTVTGSNGAV